MGRTPRFLQFLAKADAALLSAIEIYNKPDFAYREEAFAILALNAWELLLKGAVLCDNRNDLRSLYVYERRRTRSGEWNKRRFIKRNRTGNAHTKGLTQLINDLDSNPTRRLPPAVRKNLLALSEIRDNAVHYINPGPRLEKQVLEIGTASVKNYIELASQWFHRDFSKYKLYLMPIGFLNAPGKAVALRASVDEDKLMEYLEKLIAEDTTGAAKGYHVALDVNVSVKRSSKGPVASEYRLTTDPSAPALEVREEDVRRAYPWDYSDLTERLKDRYKDFLQNSKYHGIRKALRGDDRYVRTRLLDPGNTKSAKKDFYNPNIIAEFDKHYTRT